MAGVEQGDEITVVLVDDHAVVRTGLRAYFDTEPGISVVAEAADGLEALARIDALAREDRVPDVVLMDMQMPRLDGVEATGRDQGAVARDRRDRGDLVHRGGAHPRGAGGGRDGLPAQGRRRRPTSSTRSAPRSPVRSGWTRPWLRRCAQSLRTPPSSATR